VVLGNTDVVACQPQDIIRISGSGGGGYGHPHDRAAEAVLADVRGGLVSRAAARRDYGVAVTPGLALDVEETARLRDVPREAPGFLTLCEARLAFEAVWTPARYATLTALLAGLPVAWRHFVKLRLFERVLAPGDDVAAAFAALAAEYPELAAR
jgi:N-methylhydantoinase B